ncbi:MAG: TonB-dependent receptor plug domain-containing protein, partial [Gammaproteobacteria bacterium]|nr:TonB-dependent receptor plug domain-containing protein [Gammaproteobacteria bacterium]
MKINLLEKVTGFIVTLSVTALVITMPVMSQDDDEDAAELGAIEITGSRLKQTDIETARPVTVITREEIELSGFETVAQVLQNTPYNSFGSFRETSGYANGQAVVNEVSLRGLGSQRTLLLLDGRRVIGTGGSGGAANDLNQIPLAIIERIDILRDGASAIYGSDAIGGVVNIITRKDFDGMNLSVTAGKPDTPGGEYTAATITGGASNSKGNVFFTIQHYGQRPMYWNQTEWDHAYDYESYSSFGFPGTFYSPYFGYVPDSRCPDVPVGGEGLYGQPSDDGTNSNPDYPNSYDWFPYTAYGPPYDTWGFCGYDYAQDIIAVPRAKRNAMLMKSSYDITPDVTMNTVLMISQTDADSRYAGTPVTGPYPTMSADNPNHPLIGMGYDCTAMDCLSATVYIRTVPNGTRDNNVVSNSQDLRVGFEGIFDALGGINWEVNTQVMTNDIDNMPINLVNKPLLQQSINNGELDIFGVHGTTLDDLAPIMQQFNHTKTYAADLKSMQVDYIMTFDIGELAGGAIGMVLGAEYNHLSFSQINDPA